MFDHVRKCHVAVFLGMFVRRTEEETGCWRKCHNEELLGFVLSWCSYGVDARG
jgi:hypothetical protein